MKFNPGDKVRSKSTGHTGTVAFFEEAASHLRLNGDGETHFRHISDWEVVPEDEEPDATAAFLALPEGEPEAEAEPFPHTPPGDEMGDPNPNYQAPAPTVPEPEGHVS